MICNFNKPQAVAIMGGENGSAKIGGTVKFHQKGNCVLVVADINGLPPSKSGFFGFHVHEGTDCGGVDFSDTKGHYNPSGSPHPMHAGDLPPLMSCGTVSHSSVLTNRFRVSNIIGRTVMIHSMPDDFTSQPSGNAGEKIACGVIKAVK